ncbi:iron-containing alcohol dehydrogenase [Mariniphaga sediminis]|uniref:Iron-containing alcohol dehydrogenase n=1 Tax=Mariniphaga sediminis TaxID=1628158 RepID=A0A399CXK4_9BACT|nr:iron-containing alcohol dehydrogenase [Mariniphaga sediminis]RIH62790.1 iron-containing alcohol dehydrogenase [Mariniphaga sediminis]
MYNFEYRNPVKIIFGKGSIPKVADEIPENAKILMTYGGGSIKRTGVYDQVKNALKNFDLFEFGGIEPNPHYETCMKAVELIKNEKIDFLLAVGGGSVIDATKFIAAGALYPGKDPWDFFVQRYIIEPDKAIPFGAVLTLPATGSEMNGNAVITRISTQEKLAFGSPKVLPQFSILDPECVFTLPDRQVANGIVDAFVHVMEQYLTFPVNSPLQDRFAEGILLTLVEEGPKVIANRNDYEAAANFMWSATLALNGLIATGVPQDWGTHMIGHELTAYHGIDHARTLAIVLPGIMQIKRQSKKEKILQYGERIWGITEGTDDERIDKTIAKTVDFFESMGVPCTLPEYDVPVETIAKIKERFKERESKLGENKDIGYQEVEAILKSRL